MSDETSRIVVDTDASSAKAIMEALRAARLPVEVRCDTCSLHQRVDITALAEKVGEDYILFNRRSRCKQPGCGGWNKFYTARGGVFLPHWNGRAAARWMKAERLNAKSAGEEDPDPRS